MQKSWWWVRYTLQYVRKDMSFTREHRLGVQHINIHNSIHTVPIRIFNSKYRHKFHVLRSPHTKFHTKKSSTNHRWSNVQQGTEKWSYPGIRSLKTANRDRSPSLTIAWLLSLQICKISFRDFILDSGSASSAIPSSASLFFLLSNACSAVRSSLTSA